MITLILKYFIAKDAMVAEKNIFTMEFTENTENNIQHGETEDR